MTGKPLARPSVIRLYVLVSGFTVLLLGLVVRLFDMQILRHDQLAELAGRQYQKSVELRGKRGTIYDRRMRELALSVDRESIYANPAEVGEYPETVAALARALGLRESVILEKLRAERYFVWLKRKGTPEEVAGVRALGVRGVGFLTESQRVYPKQGLAGQVIGFVGTDDVGLEGIEHAYENTIAGRTVRVMLDRDARGRAVSLRSRDLREPPHGHDLVLTLDERIQFTAEWELRAQVAKAGARGGVVVVMDPHTGEILALANAPRFNPNTFREYSPKDWRERGAADSFEPGSIFKLILAAAVLEERLVRPDDMFFAEQGSMQLAGVMIRDHEKYGWLTFREILEKSSNVGAIKVGQRLGKERFYAYMVKFGFGERTGIDLPGEAAGLLRPPQQWSEVSIGSLSIGQEIATTPLQLITAISAIANGGMLVRPHLVKRVLKAEEIERDGPPVQVRRILSEATARQLTALLQGVVTRGTGKGAAVEGYAVAGKTGTAQKYDASLGRYSAQKVTASFIGYLPAEQPRVAILVSLDEPQGTAAWGGAAAAPVFKAIAQQTMRYLQIPPPTNQTLTSDGPLATFERYTPRPSLVVISSVSLVEDVKESFFHGVERVRSYVREHYLTVDVKNTRKPLKKAGKLEK
ncbi:MAG: penicillin-binding protein 2 [Nitrospinae bacterium]|nr:penicillin-binding protein 2 [Nitrospinota bacterium]